jgi:hypothetical protein
VKIRRDSAGQLAVNSVEVKHGGNWHIPGGGGGYSIHECEAKIRFSYEMKW